MLLTLSIPTRPAKAFSRLDINHMENRPLQFVSGGEAGVMIHHTANAVENGQNVSGSERSAGSDKGVSDGSFLGREAGGEVAGNSPEQGFGLDLQDGSIDRQDLPRPAGLDGSTDGAMGGSSGSRRRLTHGERFERRAQIAATVGGGKSIEDVASQFRVSIETVRNACKENGVGKARLKHLACKRAVDLVAAGVDVCKASTECKLPYSTVRRACSVAGIHPKRKVRTDCNSTHQMVTRMQWAAVDWAQRDTDIAKSLRVTRERVRQVRKSLGKPRAEDFRLQAPAIAFRKWLNENQPRVEGLTVQEVCDLYGGKVDAKRVDATLRNRGIIPATKTKAVDLVAPESLESLVVNRAFREGMTDCWEWKHSKGMLYPQIGGDSVHRQVYRQHHGEIPTGAMVLHKCDNRKCANPDHLYLGTAQDNANDRARNGKNTVGPKLNMDQVAEVRRRFGEGGEFNNLESLAAEFGTCVLTIYKVVKSKTYKTDIKPGRPLAHHLEQIRNLPQPFRARDLVAASGMNALLASAIIYRLGKKGLVQQVSPRHAGKGAKFAVVESQTVALA